MTRSGAPRGSPVRAGEAGAGGSRPSKKGPLDDCAALRALGTPAGEAAARFTERRIHGYDTTQPMSRPHAAPVHDALAVAAIVDRSVISTQHLHVDIETRGELTVGETVVDTNFRSQREPNVDVAFDADEPRFVAMLLETFARGRVLADG